MFMWSLCKLQVYNTMIFSFKQAREFANELKASTKVASGAGLDRMDSGGPVSPVSPQRPAKTVDTSTVSEAYSKMLRIFIPLLVDEVPPSARVICWSHYIFNDALVFLSRRFCDVR